MNARYEMTNPHNSQKSIIIDARLRLFLMSVRQALILIVIAIENFLEMELKKRKFEKSETE